MKKLDWINYNESRAVFAKHIKSGEVVIGYFDSICLYWDFYFFKDEAIYKCSTNMNSDIVAKEFILNDDSDLVNEKLNKCVSNIENNGKTKFAFYPKFNKILLGEV